MMQVMRLSVRAGLYHSLESTMDCAGLRKRGERCHRHNPATGAAAKKQEEERQARKGGMHKKFTNSATEKPRQAGRGTCTIHHATKQMTSRGTTHWMMMFHQRPRRSLRVCRMMLRRNLSTPVRMMRKANAPPVNISALPHTKSWLARKPELRAEGRLKSALTCAWARAAKKKKSRGTPARTKRKLSVLVVGRKAHKPLPWPPAGASS